MVYIPSATSWVFASLHNAGRNGIRRRGGRRVPGVRARRRLPDLQAEGVFNIDAIFAGIIVLTAFAFCLDQAVTIVERRLLVWQPQR
jgi:NitT/TauT family transport system permease protein